MSTQSTSTGAREPIPVGLHELSASFDEPQFDWWVSYVHDPWSARSAPRVDLTEVSPFQRLVLTTLLRHVPVGGVVTYAALAELMGRPGSARAVGRALATNPFPLLIPCHRVVRADGRIGAFLGGTDAKTWLLAHEGHVLEPGSQGPQVRLD